MSRNT